MTRAKLARAPKGAEEMFVRVPLPPELVAIVRERIGALERLSELGRSVLDLALDTARALDGDARAVGRAIAAAKKKKRARRRR